MRPVLAFLLSLALLSPSPASAARIKELVRVGGVRDHALVGYGLVVGLAGTGDGPRSAATVRSLANVLAEYGVELPPASLATRNVAAVMVTAKLAPFSELGQTLDVQVSSAGDARSLLGGTLLLTPLYGPDRQLYALAQGPLSVGGFQFDAPLNRAQKNSPTVARIPEGATVEAMPALSVPSSTLVLGLREADFTTARRIAATINAALPSARASARNPARVEVALRETQDWVDLVAQIESLEVQPDTLARIVVNERTGTVVAGSDVRVAPVTITHGELRVEVHTRFSGYGGNGLYIGEVHGSQALLVPETQLDVHERQAAAVSTETPTSVAELVNALQQLDVSTRDVIAILQAVKQAGALNAELVIQ
jgi:flagellar P-ring protein precursor FlgI